MTHVIYKGELANKLIVHDPALLRKPIYYCIYHQPSTGYKSIMSYSTYLSVWGKELKNIEPIDLPEEILFKFLALYETLDDFYEAFEIAFNK